MEDQEISIPQHGSTNEKNQPRILIGTRTQGGDTELDRNQPRLGRRESEPHSWEITYLHDVLVANFPNDRVMRDLHHYFAIQAEHYDIQFDLSYFPKLSVPFLLSSYCASDFDNRVPTMAVNILSKSTYKSDIGENVDICRINKIPVYIVFASHPIGINLYRPPFLRIYLLQQTGKYEMIETTTIAMRENSPSAEINPDAIISVGDLLPFRFGIMELNKKYMYNQSLYRLVLFNQERPELLLTPLEKANSIANSERERAEREKQRAEREKQRADDLEKKLLQL
jgi:Uma2 family endonuclease